MNKTFYYLSISIIVLGILIGFYLIYLMVYPFKTIVEKNPAELITKTVKAGGNLIIKKQYCKYTHQTATLIRVLEDDNVIPLPSVQSSLNPGCHTKNIIVPIPNYVPTGAYKLKTTSIYNMNVVRSISVDSITESFNVIK